MTRFKWHRAIYLPWPSYLADTREKRSIDTREMYWSMPWLSLSAASRQLLNVALFLWYRIHLLNDSFVNEFRVLKKKNICRMCWTLVLCSYPAQIMDKPETFKYWLVEIVFIRVQPVGVWTIIIHPIQVLFVNAAYGDSALLQIDRSSIRNALNMLKNQLALPPLIHFAFKTPVQINRHNYVRVLPRAWEPVGIDE